jgi:hypothetical protein
MVGPPMRFLGPDTKHVRIKLQKTEGELSSLIVYSEKQHVNYVYTILDSIETHLENIGYKVNRLGDQIRSGQNYLNKLEQLIDNCVLGIIILDGLRPNVLFEFGFLIGKQKPVIILQSRDAYIGIKTLYKDFKDSGLSNKSGNYSNCFSHHKIVN